MDFFGLGFAKTNGLVHVFHVILDFVIGGTDDGLEPKSADQFNTAGHLLPVHLGKRFVQYYQPYGWIALHLRGKIDAVGLGKAG